VCCGHHATGAGAQQQGAAARHLAADAGSITLKAFVGG